MSKINTRAFFKSKKIIVLFLIILLISSSVIFISGRQITPITTDSTNELNNIHSSILSKINELKLEYSNENSEEYELLHSITSLATDVNNNCIVIDIYKLSNKKINLFNNMLGKYDCVLLENTNAFCEPY